MPPKVKITKEQIILGAVELARANESLTAAALSKQLQCSTQPIFSHFANMGEVKQAVLKQAEQEFTEFLRKPLPAVAPYKATGLRYIQFARTEPQLFALLFMSPRSATENMLNQNSSTEFLIELIRESEQLSQEQATEVYKIMWLFCHGIATMIATQTVEIADVEISQLLDTVFQNIRGGEKNEISPK